MHVMEEDLGLKPPFTLGHEDAGWVAELGEGVTGFKEGDAVAVYGPWGCGHAAGPHNDRPSDAKIRSHRRAAPRPDTPPAT